MNLIKSFLLPLLINRRDSEPVPIRKANQNIPFKIGEIHFLNLLSSLSGVTNLDSILKAYKTSETKRFYPYEWFDRCKKLRNNELPPKNAFYCKLGGCNPLKAESTEHVNLVKSGMTAKQAFAKLKLSKAPPT